jgi:hypothetical protein
MKINNTRRSRAFQEYLDRQPPGRVAEILAGERQFDANQFARGTVREQAEAQYLDDLTVKVPRETPLVSPIEDMLDDSDPA